MTCQAGYAETPAMVASRMALRQARPFVLFWAYSEQFSKTL